MLHTLPLQETSSRSSRISMDTVYVFPMRPPKSQYWDYIYPWFFILIHESCHSSLHRDTNHYTLRASRHFYLYTMISFNYFFLSLNGALQKDTFESLSLCKKINVILYRIHHCLDLYYPTIKHMYSLNIINSFIFHVHVHVIFFMFTLIIDMIPLCRVLVI